MVGGLFRPGRVHALSRHGHDEALDARATQLSLPGQEHGSGAPGPATRRHRRGTDAPLPQRSSARAKAVRPVNSTIRCLCICGAFISLPPHRHFRIRAVHAVYASCRTAHSLDLSRSGCGASIPSNRIECTFAPMSFLLKPTYVPSCPPTRTLVPAGSAPSWPDLATHCHRSPLADAADVGPASLATRAPPCGTPSGVAEAEAAAVAPLRRSSSPPSLPSTLLTAFTSTPACSRALPCWWLCSWRLEACCCPADGGCARSNPPSCGF